jgi:hypothetical protein
LALQAAQTASVPPPELLVPLLPAPDDAPPEDVAALEEVVGLEEVADDPWPVDAAPEALLVAWLVPPEPELELLEPP